MLSEQLREELETPFLRYVQEATGLRFRCNRTDRLKSGGSWRVRAERVQDALDEWEAEPRAQHDASQEVVDSLLPLLSADRSDRWLAHPSRTCPRRD